MISPSLSLSDVEELLDQKLSMVMQKNMAMLPSVNTTQGIIHNYVQANNVNHDVVNQPSWSFENGNRSNTCESQKIYT